MQGSLSAILILTFIVIQPVGSVGALLDLKDQQSFLYRMDSSRLDEDNISPFYGHTV